VILLCVLMKCGCSVLRVLLCLTKMQKRSRRLSPSVPSLAMPPPSSFTCRKRFQDEQFAAASGSPSPEELLRHVRSRTYGVVARGDPEPALKHVLDLCELDFDLLINPELVFPAYPGDACLKRVYVRYECWTADEAKSAAMLRAPLLLAPFNGASRCLPVCLLPPRCPAWTGLEVVVEFTEPCLAELWGEKAELAEGAPKDAAYRWAVPDHRDERDWRQGQLDRTIPGPGLHSFEVFANGPVAALTVCAGPHVRSIVGVRVLLDGLEYGSWTRAELQRWAKLNGTESDEALFVWFDAECIRRGTFPRTTVNASCFDSFIVQIETTAQQEPWEVQIAVTTAHLFGVEAPGRALNFAFFQ
jgi:hypothetical protein